MKEMKVFVCEDSTLTKVLAGIADTSRPDPERVEATISKVLSSENVAEEANKTRGKSNKVDEGCFGCCDNCGECWDDDEEDDDCCEGRGSWKTPVVDSRFVAQLFGVPHDHLVFVIKQLLEPDSGLSEDFRASNFENHSCHNDVGEKQTFYAMTRDGMVMLTMHLPGHNAAGFRELLVRRLCEGDEVNET